MNMLDYMIVKDIIKQDRKERDQKNLSLQQQIIMAKEKEAKMKEKITKEEITMNKISKALLKTADVTSNAAINAGAGIAGTGTFVYIANHDVCNDPETSIIVGVGAGCAVGTAVKAAGMGVKNLTKKAFWAVKEKIEQKKIQKALQQELEEEEIEEDDATSEEEVA